MPLSSGRWPFNESHPPRLSTRLPITSGPWLGKSTSGWQEQVTCHTGIPTGLQSLASWHASAVSIFVGRTWRLRPEARRQPLAGLPSAIGWSGSASQPHLHGRLSSAGTAANYRAEPRWRSGHYRLSLSIAPPPQRRTALLKTCLHVRSWHEPTLYTALRSAGLPIRSSPVQLEGSRGMLTTCPWVNTDDGTIEAAGKSSDTPVSVVSAGQTEDRTAE